MPDNSNPIGKPIDRVDGPLKVRGAAKYSAEFALANMAHAVLVMSTIPHGRIVSMDTSAAERVPGVLLVLTPFNAPNLSQPTSGHSAQAQQGQGAGGQSTQGQGGQSGQAQGAGGSPKQAPRPQAAKLSLLQDTNVYYNNQPIAVVVADTLERAVDGASRVRVRYAEDTPILDFDANVGNAYTPKAVNGRPPDTSRGDFDTGWSAAAVKVDQIYTTPMENHNPMEPHATIAVWDGPDRLTLYNATQGVFGARNAVAAVFGLPPQNVRDITYFLGGGFGCKGNTWSHVPLAAMAARQVDRPVKLVLTRQQMFGMVGYRPITQQRVRLGTSTGGQLVAQRHDTVTQTSLFDEFVEPASVPARMLYAVDNNMTTSRVMRLSYGTPTYMRAPGESTGTFALETGMDELAYALKIDPIELRLRNYAETDPDEKKPYSSKSLRQCYAQGADRFGWSKRNPEPRSMRSADGRLAGWGMATCTYPARRSPASALARLLPDGRGFAEAGTQDIGTGTYTIMAQIAADGMGLPVERVLFELGDTDMPETPVSGGSQTASSTGSAVLSAARAVRAKAITMAAADSGSPLYGRDPDTIDVDDGRMFLKSDAKVGETYADLMRRQKLPVIEAQVKSQSAPDAENYASHSFGAVFCEVLVDPDLGEIRLSRIVGAYAAGRILNAKTGRSQFIGGIVFGVGMALMEQSVPDPHYGRIVNHDLAEYHVPVNADIPEIEIVSVPEIDPIINPLGAKGIGEIGITGVAAAISNAAYHATGIRVRDLPITLDKLMLPA